MQQTTCRVSPSCRHCSGQKSSLFVGIIVLILTLLILHTVFIVHINATSSSSLVLTWSTLKTDQSQSVAWGDVDIDGDLDLAIGTKTHVYLYINDGGSLSVQPDWTSSDVATTTSIVWGDFNGDGYLDLAVGNDGQKNRVYYNIAVNEQRTLSTTAGWETNEEDPTTSIVAGDLNNDGFLDLVVGNDGKPNRVYFSRRILSSDLSELQKDNYWSTSESNNTKGIVLDDYNGDGYLDMAVGNYDQKNRIYYNDKQGSLSNNDIWQSDKEDTTTSIISFDVDNDGDMDLAVGNHGKPVRIYCNDGDKVNAENCWSSDVSYQAHSLAAGDYNSDGHTDLAVGTSNQFVHIYVNKGDTTGLETTSHESLSQTADDARSLAWGDVDNDGDLDLAVGNSGQPDRLYRNDTSVLQTREAWIATKNNTRSLAWGDVDNDGDLDLAIANWEQSNFVYRNENNKHMLESEPFWKSSDKTWTTSIAWGDYDSDGWLDLAVGNDGDFVYIYHNNEGYLDTTAVWSSTESDPTTSIAWADIDNDRDLDLAVGNKDEPNRIYLNDGKALQRTATWSSFESDNTTSLAWGDYDGDGDLDLAVGNDGNPNRLYENDKGMLVHAAVWSSVESDNTTSLAWGDYDGDSDLDLAVGNDGQPNCIYRNDKGMLASVVAWYSNESDNTTSLAWGDYDGDGDLDLAVGNQWKPDRLYRNDRGVLVKTPVWQAGDETNETRDIAWGDVDNDGDLDLAVGKHDHQQQRNVVYNNARNNAASPARSLSLSIPVSSGLAAADHYASPHIRDTSTVSLNYMLTHTDSLQVKQLQAFVSLNGGGSWIEAKPTKDTQTTNLATSPAGKTHTFTWDIFGTGIMGQYDNVVVKLRAIPAVTPPDARNRIAGPYMYGSYTATSLPFRIRGTQVRVISDSLPVSNALVYRQPKDSTKLDAISSIHGEPYRTDSQGYLQGRSELGLGDTIVALVPVTATESYTYYLSSAKPNTTGLTMKPVEQPGEQTLIVSNETPLLLFNLVVSLEWDAHTDMQFMHRLEDDFRRTSEVLFDWTNGQVALGDITIYHQREYWNDAHIRIYASNRLRPNANQGGILDSDTWSDPDKPALEYEPGQIRIGAMWNRYGDTTGTIGEDWPRTLAHEIGHYALFLDDNYLGLDDAGNLIDVLNCPGAMSDPYIDNNSEFHPDEGWLPACKDTLSNRETVRSDWATILTFYPMLKAPESLNKNPGPSTMPMNTIQFHNVVPITSTQPVDVQIFYLIDEKTKGNYTLGKQARTFLLQQEGDRMIDLGHPVRDRVETWGARPGDRVCVYDIENRHAGCKEISATDQLLQMYTVDETWQPDIEITPVTSRTIKLQVHAPSGRLLKAQLFPTDYPSPTVISLEDKKDNSYNGAFTLEEPVLEGYIFVWDEKDTTYSIMSDYALGGNPGRRRMRHTIWDGNPGRRRMRHVLRSNPGRRRMRHVPLLSADGQAMLYGQNLNFDEGEFYSLQATSVHSPPSWATVVGQAYRITQSDNAPPLDSTSLQIGYMTSDVVSGEEPWITGYFRATDEEPWKPVDTTLNMDQNTASLKTQGKGTYALMSVITIPLRGDSWNNIAYPVRGSRSVSDALASIEGKYDSIWRFEPSLIETTSMTDTWKGWLTVQPPDVPTWVNTLDQMHFGKGYWIRATENITLYLKGSPEQEQPSATSLQAQQMAGLVLQNNHHSVASVPALYYGTVEASNTFTPTAGMTVTAMINETVCGESVTRIEGVAVQYAVPVVTDNSYGGGKNGCGVPGVPVTFKVGNAMMQQYPQWQNDTATELTLRADAAIDGLVMNCTNPVTVGTSLLYTATVITGTNVIYDWTFDRTTVSGPAVTHEYTQTGTYTATVTAHNSVSSQQATCAISVTEPITGLSFIVTPNPAVVSTTLTFTTTLATDTNVTYEWAFGDDSKIAHGAVVTHAYTQTGTYTATVTAHNSVSSQQATGVITVVDQIACLQGAITSLTLHAPKQATVYEETHITAEPAGGTDITYT